MRAAVFQQAGRPLAIETVPDPRPGPDQVIIEVAHAGICGSDLHVTEYGVVAQGTVLGHEFSGTVVECGSGVGGAWRPGDRVTAMPLQACRSCEACDAGLPALCSHGQFTGLTPQYPGAYAEYVAARSGMVQRLPAGVAFTDGAMVEPLAVAHHAVEMSFIRPDSAVLILGAGPIGAGVILFARLAGARHVIVSERSAERRSVALALGATAVIDPVSENVAERFAALAGRRPQVVFECIGVAGLLQQALELAAVRGQVIVAGVCFAEDRIKPLAGLMRELNIQFCQCYTEANFAAVIAAIDHERIRPQAMHTHTIGLAALPQTFEALRTRPPGCKVLIDPKRP
jgi:(R,R)-butanediol dehydrogenase / meso-butanediol dehydrogenase / diacetyl reductase